MTALEYLRLVQERKGTKEGCASCHSTTPSDDVFSQAPAGVILDSIEQIKQWAPRIKARAIDAQDMPLLNKAQMSELERAQLANWLDSAAKGDVVTKGNN